MSRPSLLHVINTSALWRGGCWITHYCFLVLAYTQEGRRACNQSLIKGQYNFRHGQTCSVCTITVAFLFLESGCSKYRSRQRIVFRPVHQPFSEHLFHAGHCGSRWKATVCNPSPQGTQHLLRGVTFTCRHNTDGHVI